MLNHRGDIAATIECIFHFTGSKNDPTETIKLLLRLREVELFGKTVAVFVFIPQAGIV